MMKRTKSEMAGGLTAMRRRDFLATAYLPK
jgi:hypothetical protein